MRRPSLSLALLAVTTLSLARPPSAPAPVTALAYHPKGLFLAAAGPREVLLLDPSGDLILALPGQGAKVTALAFRRDGGQLAVASGEPGQAGTVHLYSLPTTLPTTPPALSHAIQAHKDLVHDLAYSPDGKLLATCGYDRLVKLWDPITGQEVRTLKDHSDAVYGVSFSPDGQVLASAAADRTVKIWEVATGKRLYSLGEATDWLYAVAWSPKGSRVAAGGVDRSIRVWEATPAGGKIVQSAFAHEKAILRLVYSADGQTLYSLGEDRTVKAWDAARLTERKVFPAQPETVLALALRPDGKQLALGRFDGAAVLLDAATGQEQARPLPVRFPPVATEGPNDAPGTAPLAALPCTWTGQLGRAGAVAFVRFHLAAGQEVGAQVVPVAGGKLDPVLTLLDPANDQTLAEGNGKLGFRAARAGAYALGIRDREYRGGADFRYRVRLGDVPVVTGVFPLGVQAGRTTEVRVDGVHLGGVMSVKVAPPAGAAPGSRVPLVQFQDRGPGLGDTSVVVGEFPEVTFAPGQAAPHGGLMDVPGTANGVIAAAGQAGAWRFRARKGQRLIVEALARRYGSPLDPVIDILDDVGRPVPRAVLRCVARTNTTFRDHDSTGPGIRLDDWRELAVNDYLYVGTELVRILQLPRNPDDDCQFFQVAGQRQGFLDTTPTHHALGTPMYKVEIHPPGTTFPPNGFPVVTLLYHNDDGGPGYGKDSRLFFDPPADGTFQVRITDARGAGGPDHAYRLTVRPPRPDFTLSFSPQNPAVWKGGALPVTVTATRLDGFAGPIPLRLENLPPGFSAPATFITPEENGTALALFAAADAQVPTGAGPIKAVARALIDGKEVVREAAGGVPKLAEPGDLTTATEQDVVTVRPGGEVKVTARIERRNGFVGRVPLDVTGLPHGVRVLDVGLNGILITEKETVRTFVIYCEPWVPAMEHPFVVLARREGKNSEHAAKAVLLKVVR